MVVGVVGYFFVKYMADFKYALHIMNTGIAAWIFGHVFFAFGARGLTGRLQALAEYHLFATCFGFLSALIGCLLLQMLAASEGQLGVLIMPLIFATPFLLSCFGPGRWLNRRMYAALLPLVRQRTGLDDLDLPEMIAA